MEGNTIKTDTYYIAYCGLYCAACRKFTSGKCPGCKDNIRATWCKVRQCCIENNYRSCADCTKSELLACKKFNNNISKLIGLIFRSDRPACIARIKEIGYDYFATEMAVNKRQTIRKD